MKLKAHQMACLFDLEFHNILSSGAAELLQNSTAIAMVAFRAQCLDDWVDWQHGLGDV